MSQDVRVSGQANQLPIFGCEPLDVDRNALLALKQRIAEPLANMGVDSPDLEGVDKEEYMVRWC